MRIYIYICMQLCVDYSILAYTKIFLWTKHACLSTHISVFVFSVCMFLCLRVCWEGVL